VLDLGGVVCRFDPAARRAALEELTGMESEAIDEAIWGSGLDAAAERGEIDPSTMRVLVAGALGGRIDVTAIRTAWSYAFVPDETVLALVDRLTVPAVVFTNNGPLLSDCLDHELLRVRGRFSQVLCSWELGATKPDLEAFRAVTARLEADPADVLFVDDSDDNVTAAREVGWRAERFTGADALGALFAGRDLLE
jgi:putative hydrolase of the HAD superfamily